MKILPKRRKSEKKTNYAKRRKLLEHSNARIVIRKSNKYILIQYIESKESQDSAKVSVISKQLVEYGWPAEKSLKNLGAAYLSGILFGIKLKKLPKAVLDTGLIRSTKGSKIYSAVKGIIDSGIELNCDPKMFPEENRIKKAGEFFDKVKEKITQGSKK